MAIHGGAIGACDAAVPVAGPPGLLRDARNDVGFLSVIARRAQTDVAIQTRAPWLRQPANWNPPLALAQPECHPPGPWIASRCSQ